MFVVVAMVLMVLAISTTCLLFFVSFVFHKCFAQMGVLASKIQKKMPLPQAVDIGEEVNKLAEDVKWGSR